MIVSRIIFGALIAIASVAIALALTTGWTFGPFWSGVRTISVYRSEDPVQFWLSVVVWAITLVVALWTVIRLIRSRLL